MGGPTPRRLVLIIFKKNFREVLHKWRVTMRDKQDTFRVALSLTRIE